MVLGSRSHTELNLQFVSFCSFVHELMRLMHCIFCSHLAKFQFQCLILWTMRCFRGHCGKSGRVSLVGFSYVMLCPVHFKQLRGGCCGTNLYHLPCTRIHQAREHYRNQCGQRSRLGGATQRTGDWRRAQTEFFLRAEHSVPNPRP